MLVGGSMLTWIAVKMITSWQAGEISNVGNWLVSIHFVEGNQPVPEPIGTGFVVGAVGEHRLALTAAHVLDEMIRRVMPERATGDSGRKRAIETLLRQQRVVALIGWEDGRCTQHAISGFASYTFWDSAAFFIGPPTGGWPKNLQCVLIDASVPRVGTQVAVISFEGMQRSKAVTLDGKRSAQIFRRPSGIRIGQIVEVHLHGHRLARGPCMGLNVPTTPGMSGGPIFCWDGHRQGPKVACGIVSSDFSSAEAHVNQSVPGDSTGVLVAAALPLTFSMQFGQKVVSKNIRDLVVDGRVKERGQYTQRWAITYPPPDGVRMCWNEVA